LGNVTIHFITAIMDLAICWVYILVLCHRKQKRKLFPLRLFLMLALNLFLCVGIGFIRTAGNDALSARILFEFALGFTELLNIIVLYRESVSETLMMFSGVIVTKNFSGTVIPLLRNLLGNNDMETISFFADYIPLRDWTIFIGLQLLFLSLIAYFFYRAEKYRHITLTLPGAAFLSTISMILKCVVAPIARHYQPVSLELSVFVKTLMILLYIVVIAIRSGLIAHKKIETELQITESLLRQEKKRYHEMRDNIELINMRCHDLKRQLSRLQSKLTLEEVEALRDAIEIYDSNINTGNEILDTVLYQKELYCRKHGITLSWMCDGRCLYFIAPSSLYSLLENALENAIEAVFSLPDEQKLITVNVLRNNTAVTIEVTNYYDTESSGHGGTTKADKVHHGFGLKSIRYVAASYGGTVDTACVDDVFILSISIPLA